MLANIMSVLEFIDIQPELRTRILSVVTGHAPLTDNIARVILCLIHEASEAQHEHPA